MSLQDRIKEVIDASGLTPAEFSRAAKVSPSAINQLTEGKTKSLKAETAANIELATGYRAVWLAVGRGKKKIDSVTTPQPAAITLEFAMESLSHFLSSIPQADRETASAALSALAKNPDTQAQKSALLRLLITNQNFDQERATGT
jgi:transcriptional regulator with XRE-family HTH domain